MERKCQIRLQIEGDPVIYNTQEKWDLHLGKSTDIFYPPMKDFESEEYPELHGEILYPYTTFKSFDYVVSFIYVGSLLEANAKIKELFDSLYVPVLGREDLLRAKQVTVFNDYKGVKIVGYPTSSKFSEYIWQEETGVIRFDFSLKVAKPQLCDFNMQ